MNVISKRTIVQFYEKHASSKTALEVWYSDAKKADWKTSEDVKAYDGSASILADNRVVFDIKGNDYRMVVHIDYLRGFIRVKFIGTHAEYNKINAETIGGQ